MPIDRRELKTRAKLLIAGARPKPTVAALIMIGLLLVMGFLSNRMLFGSFSISDMNRYMQYLQNGYYDGILEIVEENMPSNGAMLLSSLLQLMYNVVSLGFLIFCLNTIRSAGAVYGNLLDGFGMFFRFLWLTILETVFISLWSLLLIVPGIIASYRYRMAVYLLIDHPEMTAYQCIKESGRMMKGHKGELFVMDLSFIGWDLLESIGYLGYAVMIFSMPYKELSYALYYEALSGSRSNAYNFYEQF